jgi:hypothetical protein
MRLEPVERSRDIAAPDGRTRAGDASINAPRWEVVCETAV